jgi:large subunit ribosomal protein L41
MLRRPVVARVEQISDGIFLRAKSKFARSVRQTRRLTSKKGNRIFYKGRGANKGGRTTSKGKFIMDPEKMLSLQVPDLAGCTLKPYVSTDAPKRPESSSE